MKNKNRKYRTIWSIAALFTWCNMLYMLHIWPPENLYQYVPVFSLVLEYDHNRSSSFLYQF